MNCKFGFVFFAAIFFFAPGLFADEISITASVEKNVVALNEYIVYSLTVRGDSLSLPDPQLGRLDNFNQYGSGRSQNISIINGKKSASVTHSYTLGPKSVGKFTIPPSSIKYKGEVYSTQAIEIEVVKAPSSQNVSVSQPQPRRQTNRAAASAPNNAQVQGKAFVKASVNKKTVYQNEKLIYKFSFYTNVALASNPEYFAPDFSGFWNDGAKPSNRVENIDGIDYNVSEVETVLYPIESGNKIIAPTKLRIAVMDFSSPSNLDDFFGSFFQGVGQRQIKTLESDEIKINVLPLPLENRPEDFYGAIGVFKISASLDKTSAAVNEPVALTLRASGSGNMKSVHKIDFDVKDGFRKYDTVVSDVSAGVKEFKIILVPVSPGKKTIPAAKLSFFNPAKKKYETVETQPLELDVSGEAVYDEEASAENAKINAKRKDINYNKRITDLKRYSGAYVKDKKFYLLFVPFLLLFIGGKIYFFALSKRGSDNAGARFRKAKKLIEKASCEISKENFVSAGDFIYDALLALISVKIKVSPENLRKEQIAEKMLKAGVSQEIVEKTETVFETLNFLRFASVKADKKELRDLIEAVKKIATEFK
ncbi:MAG: BatD family protein [Endomicrobium sp.]|jgi:hypothetical protein|nr:BatD family protein [Endomicrobium sp.]